MLEALLTFVFEVVLYGKGYGTLKLLSAGRIKPQRWNDGLVSLVGVLATLLWCVPLAG